MVRGICRLSAASRHMLMVGQSACRTTTGTVHVAPAGFAGPREVCAVWHDQHHYPAMSLSRLRRSSALNHISAYTNA